MLWSKKCGKKIPSITEVCLYYRVQVLNHNQNVNSTFLLMSQSVKLAQKRLLCLQCLVEWRAMTHSLDSHSLIARDKLCGRTRTSGLLCGSCITFSGWFSLFCLIDCRYIVNDAALKRCANCVISPRFHVKIFLQLVYFVAERILKIACASVLSVDAGRAHWSIFLIDCYCYRYSSRKL